MKVAAILSFSVLCIAIALLIFIFIRKTVYNIIDCRIERFQSEIIINQVREIENMYLQVRGWRHDYRNHIQNMKIQLAEKNYEKLSEYLDSLACDLETVDTVIKTGNVMADAILNSKLNAAEKLNVQLNVKAAVPEKLKMTDVELCSMLGNLLDNAIEACASLPENERFIRIYIGRFKGQFYMSVQNSAGKLRKERGTYISTKPDAASHGYGIFRIDRIVKKYGGYVNRQSEKGVFATELMVPLG